MLSPGFRHGFTPQSWPQPWRCYISVSKTKRVSVDTFPKPPLPYNRFDTPIRDTKEDR
jgi:hypothetical protein